MSTYLFFWDIPKNKIAAAILRMANGHVFLKFNKKVAFYKLLGTGKGETFTPNDANSLRWGLLLVMEGQPSELSVIKSWRRISSKERSFELRAIAAHGKWAKRQPFAIQNQVNKENKVAVITRARIKFKLNRKFWSYVPPVVVSLRKSPGLIWSIGIGEAPIGLQGTFSLWENSAAVAAFAFKDPAHAGVIKKTRELNWYSEELFARFEVISEAE